MNNNDHDDEDEQYDNVKSYMATIQSKAMLWKLLKVSLEAVVC
jgi:hypothetical protein